MSIFTINKNEQRVTMILPKEGKSRDKIRRDFSMIRKDERNKTRFHMNSEDSFIIKELEIKFNRTEFISRAAADEILCQTDMLTTKLKFKELSGDISKMMAAVRKTHHTK